MTYTICEGEAECLADCKTSTLKIVSDFASDVLLLKEDEMVCMAALTNCHLGLDET